VWVSDHRPSVLNGWFHDGREQTGTGGGDLGLAVVRLAATRESGEIYERERERERERGGENLRVFNFFIEKLRRMPRQFVSICV
jgi:hypothetical protein